MKIGDLFNGMLVLEVWDFKKYCNVHDELELEYDIEDAWDHWQKAGPLLVVFDPERQTASKVWSK
tara:strand:+ start:92 stop:286 length:195 start_codon:yes stop_codon:yes gene_type:complete